MNCPGCESPRTQTMWEVADDLFRTSDEKFHLERCQACGLLFLDPVPADLARFYPETYWPRPAQHEPASALRWRWRERYRRLLVRGHARFVRQIAELQSRRGRTVALLDVGCGDGSFLAACGNLRRVGLDSSLTALRGAGARGLAVTRSSLLAPPFPDRSFSIISMFHFLEHVSPPRPYLEAARALLADDGALVIQVPNAASWQAYLLGGKWSGYEPPRHLVNYSRETLRRTLARAGFQVVREKHFSLRDNAAVLARTLAPSLYPPARDARTVVPQGWRAWLADLGFLALTLACFPFALLESLFGHGATIMVEAHKAPREAR